METIAIKTAEKQQTFFIHADDYNEAVRVLNTLSLDVIEDFDLSRDWFFINLGNEWSVKINKNAKYQLEKCDEPFCLLGEDQIKIVNDFIDSQELEYA